jgi:hypothetical protein
MRSRRPHLFSDSEKRTEVALTREVLSHHLDTLTKQKSETVFESFAKRLVEKFIAPNLRPQTGPTGGGDGKTDAETYPVASDVSDRWFAADPAAALERWAFAFSAKEDWRGKVRSDTKAIVGTGRGYPRIYFVTNQYAPARQSADVQDNLEEEYGISVTILDRTWLLDSVFERDSLDIAQQTLGVGSEVQAKRLGPRDLKRQHQLDKIEKLLGDGANYQGRSPALADDALRAAQLARGLEKPRFEVDGRYERAVRIAREHQLSSQNLAAVYEWAWTSYFWLDDAQRLTDLYDQVEKLAIDSDSANDLERLNNLLPLLASAIRHGMLSSEDGAIERRQASLVAALEVAKNDAARRNNALHAHALLLLTRVTMFDREDHASNLDEIWEEFKNVISQSRGLGTFPFESIANTLTQLGDLVPESTAFDDLYEALTDALSERKKEGEAAKLNSERAYQKLKKRLHYDAIRWFGRAVSLLVKAEYEDELIEALCGCSVAYMEAGLYWAARNYALAATATECRKYKQSGSADDINPAVLSQWFACELQLGRVPFALVAYELGATVRYARSRTQEEIELSERRRIEQGHGLAALLLGTNFDDLKHLTTLPAALDKLDLLQASTTLLFLMGGGEALRTAGAVPTEETSAAIESVFNGFAVAAKAAALPKPDYLLTDRVTLQSRVLGCEVIVSCENSLTSIAIGEALLGALESLLATSLNLRIFPNLDRLGVHLQSKKDVSITPTLEFAEQSGSTVAVVTHRPTIQYPTWEEATEFPRWLQDAVIRIFVTFAVPEDPEAWGDTVLGQENGFSRAITFSNTPIAYEVIFGSLQRLSLDRWFEEGDLVTEITRTSGWSTDEPKGHREEIPLSLGVGDPPSERFDVEAVKHSDYRIVSPIDTRKWEAAHWQGAFFMSAPGSEMVPLLGLAFEHREPAVGIFEAWHERFGDSDADQNLRVAIITGANISNPHAYAMVVGPNMDRIKASPSSLVGFVAQVKIMQPQTSNNLDLFLSEFRRLGRFRLVAAHWPSIDTKPKVIPPYSLEKLDLVVRPAWTITENDPDSFVLNLDDPPVIPIDQVNPPVLKAMERRAKFAERRRQERGGET